MECKQERNSQNCNCTYPCSRHAVCCDCLHYHRKSGELPACYFPASAVKTYDRSIDYFISLWERDRGSWLTCRFYPEPEG
jgi:hypothetical protein